MQNMLALLFCLFFTSCLAAFSPKTEANCQLRIKPFVPYLYSNFFDNLLSHYLVNVSNNFLPNFFSVCMYCIYCNFCSHDHKINHQEIKSVDSSGEEIHAFDPVKDKHMYISVFI